ncbi:SRPBCC family protein [Parafrankia sp. EUN1f]|uniref:SRPBCC family protein n=1 Tax=Parafrankia sp. EUN1f TaxID=102897 RepID=UPI0001C43A6A|nr:SRPBCC family protein [Parafrankia sp. EUN1f]EFC84218.1 cyclase/dehydrase [Parafrankia sp. EUN1f]
MTQPTEQSNGLTGVLLHNPATRRLADQVQDLAKAGGSRLAGSIGERLASGTDRLNHLSDSDGQTSSLIDGARRLAEGQSPFRAAAGSVMSNVKDKVKGALGSLKGRAGGKGGPPKATNIEESVDIGVPVSVAFDQWTQYPEFAKFMKGVEAVEAKSETEQNWRVKVFKSRRSWQAKVTEQVPDRRIAWTSEGAKGSVKGAVTFHPLADDLTRVLLAMEYYPSGFMEKTGNMWRAGGRRARLDLKHFRRFITLRGEATGSWRGEIRDGEVVRSPDDDSEEGGEETGNLESAQAAHDENDQVPATSGSQGGGPESSDQNSELDEQAGAEEPVRA